MDFWEKSLYFYKYHCKNNEDFINQHETINNYSFNKKKTYQVTNKSTYKWKQF